MKDIDFDELDRAVSSLLDAKDAVSTSGAVPSPVAIAPGTTTTPSTATATQVNVEPTLSKTLIQKRATGRFMDVVHPSSDMRVQNKPAVSRQAPTIAPIDKAPTLVVAAEEEVPVYTPEPLIVPPAPTSNEDHRDTVQPMVELDESTVDNSDTHAMPDPLDFHGFTAVTEPVAMATDAVAVPEVVATEPTESDPLDALIDEVQQEVQQAETPLATPFVADASPEKRPLGAYSATSPTPAAADEVVLEDPTPDTMPIVEPVTETAVLPQEATTAASTEEEVPEELHQDIVAVESQGVQPEAPSLVPEVAAEPATPAPAANGAITQQYKETAPVATDAVAPVFDTETYHKPIQHTAKNRSGAMTIIWIVVLIVLGVGGGTAFYYFDPFNLL